MNKQFNIRFDGCGIGDIEDVIPDDVTWIVIEDDEDGMTIGVDLDTIVDYAADPNEFVAYLTGPGKLPDGLLVTFLAMVPHGWSRDVDPRKAIRSARRQVGLKGTTPYVVFRSTDLEAYVDSYGRVWSDPKAIVVQVDETGGQFSRRAQ